MHLLFRGTRGGITAHSKQHHRHSSLLVEQGKTRILIDYGKDWLRTKPPAIDALFITHAHKDHAGGLSQKITCPVYATEKSWPLITHAVPHATLVEPEVPVDIGPLRIIAYTIKHSLRAPAVGYKILSKKAAIFYIPDVVAIPHLKKALAGIDLYIGDGALITRTTLVRMKEDTLVGHAPVIQQLEWCAAAGIKRMIITHCGTQITTSDPASIAQQLAELQEAYGIEILLAHDGMELNL